MHTDKIKTGKLFGFHHRFKVCTGARYLGSYIRYDRTKHNSLKKRTEVWDRNIFTIRKTVGKYTPGKLRRNGMRDAIGVDISTTHHHE